MGYTMKNVMSWRFVVCSLLAQLAHIHAGNVVPVMLWYGETSASLVNPLHKTSRPEFEGILAERLYKGQQPPMIVFVKDNFCAEDIKHHKESLQQLNNAGSLTFLTSVDSALSVFENLSSYNVTMEDDLESVAEGQLALVQVTDLNAIPEIYNMVRESSPNLIVALTGRSCGYSSSERIKRETPPPSISSLNLSNDKRILFHADQNPWIKYDNKEYKQLSTPTPSIITDQKGYSLKLSFLGSNLGLEKISLTARFEIVHGYFNFIGFKYEDENVTEPIFLRSRREIVYPFNVSYHCQQDNYFTYKNKDKQISVKIQNLQVQMDTEKFGEVYDCVGFMSIPIWTGIFVTAILALIMIWGLTMIMDIRTMDRFDDPKGKTITISAQE